MRAGMHVAVMSPPTHSKHLCAPGSGLTLIFKVAAAASRKDRESEVVVHHMTLPSDQLEYRPNPIPARARSRHIACKVTTYQGMHIRLVQRDTRPVRPPETAGRPRVYRYVDSADANHFMWR